MPFVFRYEIYKLNCDSYKSTISDAELARNRQSKHCRGKAAPVRHKPAILSAGGCWWNFGVGWLVFVARDACRSRSPEFLSRIVEHQESWHLIYLHVQAGSLHLRLFFE